MCDQPDDSYRLWPKLVAGFTRKIKLCLDRVCLHFSSLSLSLSLSLYIYIYIYIYIYTSQLMLYREIIALCSEIHTKHINTVSGQNVGFESFKLAVHIVTAGL